MASRTNFEVHEGTVSGSEVIVLVRRPRRIVITNDSGSGNLGYKFKASQDYGTLKPTETVSLDFNPTQVHLQGSVNYRI